MDPFKIATIAHRKLEFCSPVNADDLDAMIGKLRLDAGAEVLDLGCGKGQVLARIAARYPSARLHGIDVNPAYIEEAQACVSDSARAAKLNFETADLKKMAVHPGSIDMVVSIGSMHIFGSFAQALRTFHTMLRAGGVALAGHGYWKRPPDPAYRKHIYDSRESDFSDNAGNLKAVLACGFEPLAAAVSSDDDWAAYERTWGETLMEYVALHPTDPDVQPMLQRALRRRDNYFVHGGRETLGFAMYLLKKR